MERYRQLDYRPSWMWKIKGMEKLQDQWHRHNEIFEIGMRPGFAGGDCQKFYIGDPLEDHGMLNVLTGCKARK